MAKQNHVPIRCYRGSGKSGSAMSRVLDTLFGTEYDDMPKKKRC